MTYALFGLGFPLASALRLNPPFLISRRLILQQAHGQPFFQPPIACRLTVSCSFSLPSRGSFHLSLAVLFSIAHTVIFSLTSWSRLIHTGFLLPRTTRDSPSCSPFSTTGLLPSSVQFSLASFNFLLDLLVSHYPTLLRQWFRLFPFRSPLLGKSLLLSFPLATKMFQFTRFSRLCLFFSAQRPWGCPIRSPPSLRLLPAPRSLSWVATSFFVLCG